MKLILVYISIALIATSCVSKHKAFYFINKSEKKIKNKLLSDITIKLDPIVDNRSFKYKFLLNSKYSKGISKDGKNYCLNVEKRYNERYWKELDFLTSKYLNHFIGAKKVILYESDFDYRISWKLSNFYIKQLFPEKIVFDRKSNIITVSGNKGNVTNEAVASIFSKNKRLTDTEGEVKIVIEDITISNKEGIPIKTIDKFEYHLLEESMLADAKCKCAYYNIDLYYKHMLKELSPLIETAIIQDLKK